MATLAWAPVAISISPARATRKERIYFCLPAGGAAALRPPAITMPRIRLWFQWGRDGSEVNSADFFASCRSSSPRRASILQPVPGSENPPHQRHTAGEKAERDDDADPDADIGDLVKAPAETGDQIDHRIEQGNGAPARRQHVHGVETAAEEGQRRHHQHRNHLQLLEPVGPDADDEAEQAEGDGS